MTLRRLVFIVNPRAGDRTSSSLREAIDGWIRNARSDVEVEWHFTQQSGHATLLARSVEPRDGTVICAVGGDGTFHEVANGLLARDPTDRSPLAVIPSGTGNSLARDLALDGPEDAISRTLSGAGRWLDAGEVDVDGRVVYSINIVGWGAFARINRRAESLRFLGGGRYSLSAFREITRIPLRRAEASLDGSPSDRFLMGAACITRHTGRGMIIAPKAVLDDGYADLVLVRPALRPVLASILSRVYSGRHIESSKVEYRRVDRLHLRLEPEAEVVIDGELMSAREISMTMLARALRLTV